MKELNVKQYLVEDDYYIDIIKEEDGFEVWFYDDCAGFKTMIMNVDLEATEEELLEEVRDNFIEYRDAYDEMVEALDEDEECEE